MESTEHRLDPIAIHVMNAYCHIIDKVLNILDVKGIRYISNNTMLSIISFHGSLARFAPEDKFLSFDCESNKWVACDNTTSDCFVEEFVGIERAIEWLDSEEGPVDD